MMDEHDAEMDSERNETPDAIAVIVEQWRVARSHFRDNNDQGRFEPLAMQMEHSGGDWLLTLLAERERLLQLVARHELRIECLEAEMNTDIFLFAMRNYEAALAELEGKE